MTLIEHIRKKHNVLHPANVNDKYTIGCLHTLENLMRYYSEAIKNKTRNTESLENFIIQKLEVAEKELEKDLPEAHDYDKAAGRLEMAQEIAANMVEFEELRKDPSKDASIKGPHEKALSEIDRQILCFRDEAHKANRLADGLTMAKSILVKS